MRLDRAIAIVSAALLSVATAAPSAAQEQAFRGAPVFWDVRERLPKPDLGTMKRLRFLTTTDFPPFNFLDGQGRLSGFHVDLARAICAEVGLAASCEIQALPWDELEGALAEGEGEAILAGIAVTGETRAKFAFSRPYLQFPARFMTGRAGALTEPLSERIRGRRVGVIAGSDHERMLRRYFPAATVVALPTQEALYADMKASRIDAAFGDGMRFAFWLAGADASGCCRFAGGPYLSPDYLGHGLAVAVPAGEPALAQAFDYALHQIALKGTFAELYLRYFPVGFF